VNIDEHLTKGERMETLFLLLGWGSPIGTGIFLMCLGGMLYLLTKADAIYKRVRWEEKEKK